MSSRRNIQLATSPLYSWSLTALAIAGAAWFGWRCGTFQWIDGPIYDSLMRIRSSSAQREPQVLLIEMDDGAALQDETPYVEAIRKLSALGCQTIILDAQPAGKADALIREAASHGNVLLARRLVEDPGEPGRLALQQAPDQRFDEIPWGVVRPPPQERGIHRAMYSGFVDADRGRRYRSVELEAARRQAGVQLNLKDSSYLVDFRGGVRSLPVISMERLLDGDLIRELVVGKCVLIGRRARPDESPLATPTTPNGMGMSLLEYQGQAVNTLLSGTLVRGTGPLRMAIILVVVCLLSKLVYQYFSVQVATRITIAVFLACAGTSVVLFVSAGRWLPLGSLTAAQLALFTLTLRGGAHRLTLAMQQVVSDASSQLRDKYWPLLSYRKDPHWALVGDMINQTLDLNRQVFLEAKPGKKRLKEILAVHCSLDDISERRRDYDRAPYVHALNQKAPIRVRGYLKSGSQNEEQYIAPLTFFDEVLGFWVLGVDESKAALVPRFEAVLKDYSQKISELLYYTRRIAEREARSKNLRQRLVPEQMEVLNKDMNAALGLLNERLGTLETLLDRIESGVIVYDVFGRVLQINNAMLQLLKKEDLKPFDMTALDLILAISDYDAGTGRKLLRRVIVEDSSISFPVTLASSLCKRFRLHMKPLGDGKATAGVEQRIAGKNVLCELIDTTAVSALYEMKQRLTGRLNLQLRRDFASIGLCADILKTTLLPVEQRTRVAEIVEKKVQGCVQILSDCQQYIGLDGERDDVERVPVDPELALQMAQEEVGTSPAGQRTRFDCTRPAFLSFVFASPSRLEKAFRYILQLLCEDSTDSSEVRIRIEEARETAVFEFENAGFGIPDDLFQDYLQGQHGAASENFQKLQGAVQWVRSWGGTLDGRSGIGEGMLFRVELVRFL